MQKDNSFLDILLFVLAVIAGLFFAQFLTLAVLLPFYKDLQGLMDALNNPLQHPEIKMQLLAMQGISAFSSFVLAPWAFIKWRERNVLPFLYKKATDVPLIGLAIGLTLVSTPFISLIVEWNESIVLPSQFSWVEDWAKQKENYLKEITEMLTSLDNPTELAWGLVVIAFLPALGEELVFRGYLQQKIGQLSQNPHMAIWVSAFLFSAIHFQFYGFFPRMLLGALFGYMYHFSGQFHLPVVAHFTNNGLMLVLIYLKDHGAISYDIEKEDQASLPLAFLSLGLAAALFSVFVRRSKKES